MVIQRESKLNISEALLMIMLLVCTNKWLFEGLLGMSILENILLGACVGIAVLHRKVRISKASAIWLLYLFSILFSVVYHSASSTSIWRRALVFGALTLLPLVFGCHRIRYERVIRLMIKVAIFHGVFVVIHFLLKDRFVSLYSPMLRSVVQPIFSHYARQKYYFGLLYSPHEVAGMMAYAAAYLILRNITEKRKGIKPYLPAAAFLVIMLLTGKKSPVLILPVALVLTLMLLYSSRRQLLRIVPVLLLLTAGALFLRYYILTHANGALFYRLTRFLQVLSEGGMADSGRLGLYEIANALWRTHKWLGIGWSHFTTLTVTVYGYSIAHQVNMDYLQWLCEMGLVGFVLNMIPLLVTFGQALFVGRRGTRLTADSSEHTVINFFVFIQIYTVIYAFVEVPFYDIFYFYMFMLSCMVINRCYVRYVKPARRAELAEKSQSGS